MPAAPAWLRSADSRLIAHRCGGAMAPENTLAGLRAAAARGFRAVEFDVMLSADGTPVLIHDETLERTTNGAGWVCATPDSVLRRLDAGGGEPVPTLAEALALCRCLGLMANVEIKPAAGFEALTGTVAARCVAERWGDAADSPLLSSFSPLALDAARRVAPALPRGLLFDRPPPDWVERLAALEAATLNCAAGELSDAVLLEAAARGVPVLCYTVNDAALAERLFARGVAAVFTDRLDLFSR